MTERADDVSQLAKTAPASAPSSSSSDPAMSTVASDATLAADATVAAHDATCGAAPLHPGATIARYRLTARLGAGAMGEVWSALDPQLDRKVAIKLLHPTLAGTPEISARMVREARAMAKVSHRGVVAIHDAGEAEGRLFLAMEMVPGTTLGALLRARGADELRDWRRWLAMLIEAGRGLAAAHAAGVLHRDFKPDNVLVDEHGRVCVGDFGLASIGASAAGRASQATIDDGAPALELTTTGSLLGTPAYMSLEQLHGAEVDARADQFSFCVAAYEALYGTRPFEVPGERATIATLAAAIDAGAIQPPPPEATVPDAVRAIVVRGLAVDPAARWPDLGALLDALDRTLGAVPPRVRGQRRRIAMAVAVGVVATAGVAIGVRGRGAPGEHASPAPVPRLIAPVPLRSTLALSSGGRLAIGTDRIEVRDPATNKTWRITPPGHDPSWVYEMEFDGEDVVRWGDRSVRGAVRRWDFVHGAESVLEPGRFDGRWLGGLSAGELYDRVDPSGQVVVYLVRDGRVVQTWPVRARALEMFAIAPSRHRFAYFENDRFSGRIVVVDATTNQRWASDQIVEPTGLTWSRDDLLLYAVDGSDATISELPLTPSGLGRATVVHHLTSGWAGHLLAAGRRIFYVHYVVNTRTRELDRDTMSVREFDPSVAGAGLGWTADDSFFMWSRGTGRVERWKAGRSEEPTNVVLGSEPANATFAADVLIASLRETGGRQLVAMSLTTGARLWSHPKGTSLAARCAQDRHPPCFVARRIEGPRESYEVLALDPVTGATSGAPLYRGTLEDIAVRADGARLLVADGSNRIVEIDREGTVLSRIEAPLSIVRSLSYDPRGGVMFAGTVAGSSSYAVARYDGGAFATLSQADSQVLSLVRPAPASGQVLTLGRALSSDLWELELPALP